MKTFADRFRHARAHSGLTLAKIAERIGVSTQAVWQYENRPNSSVSVEFLFPLADVLGVEARWLVTGEGVMCGSEVPSLAARRAEELAKSLAVLTDDKLHALSVLLGIRL